MRLLIIGLCATPDPRLTPEAERQDHAVFGWGHCLRTSICDDAV